MTNAEKYLKDGVDIQDFVDELKHMTQVMEWNGKQCLFIFHIKDWLKEQSKPTLSEDEKVILRNLCKWIIKIGRYDNEICLIDNEDSHEELWYLQDGLFSFIQERRRI